MVALCLLAFGGFGLLTSVGSRTELADQTRRQLQAFNRALRDRFTDLPRDLAVSTEEVATTTSDDGTLDLFFEPDGFAAGNYFFAITSSGCVDYSIEARYADDPLGG